MIKPFLDWMPMVKGLVYIADDAQIIGKVHLEEGVSV